jgi:hypothetical protein
MTPFDEIATMLQAMGCSIEPCGSRVTCSPPPMDTDADYLVLCPSEPERVTAVINAMHGFCLEWEGGEHYQAMIASDFMSWRRGEINLIVTSNDRFAAKHRVATGLCKRLNLMHKPDRIALFQGVLYGNEYDPTRDKFRAEPDDMPDVEPDPSPDIAF